MASQELAAYEERFRHAGLPLLIEDYSARGDVFTRAAPLLALVFIAEMLGAIDLEWSLLANVGAAIGGLAILIGAFGLLNLARQRRFFAVPEDIGKTELAAFVVIPAALPLIFSGQTTSAWVTALVNLALVGLIYLVVGYGFFSIVRWSAGRLFAQLIASLDLLAKALPLLLIFSLVIFLTAEMWQISAALTRALLGLVAGLFVALGILFLVARLPREVRQLEADVGDTGAPLDARQRVNVGLVMLVSQGLQVLIVSVASAAFFVAFGLLAIDPAIQSDWSGEAVHELVGLNLFGDRLELTEELLRVSGFIAAFSGLYYAIAVLTDSTYREEFLDELTGEMRETFRARGEYLRLRASSPGSA